MAIVTSEHGAATANATMLMPTSAMLPSIGSTSSTTESGFRMAETPKNMSRKPARRSSQQRNVLALWAAANISAASFTPSFRSDTFLPFLAV